MSCVDMVEGLLPPEFLQAVDDLDCALQSVEEQLSSVLPYCTRESFEQLSLVERAAAFFALSKTLTVLFSVHLRTNGVLPDEHPATSELGRVDLYQGKVEKAVNRSTGPRRPVSSLDVQAANRFIEHAIPDLSEQKKCVLGLGKKVPPKRQQELGTMNSIRKKRPSGLTLSEEAAAFLAEASKESVVKRGGKFDSEKD